MGEGWDGRRLRGPLARRGVDVARLPPHFNPPPLRGCVTISEMVKNVMLNQVLNLIQDLRFQHLIKSIGYETLK
jgi:hypothetical protein